MKKKGINRILDFNKWKNRPYFYLEEFAYLWCEIEPGTAGLDKAIIKEVGNKYDILQSAATNGELTLGLPIDTNTNRNRTRRFMTSDATKKMLGVFEIVTRKNLLKYFEHNDIPLPSVMSGKEPPRLSLIKTNTPKHPILEDVCKPHILREPSNLYPRKLAQEYSHDVCKPAAIRCAEEFERINGRKPCKSEFLGSNLFLKLKDKLEKDGEKKDIRKFPAMSSYYGWVLKAGKLGNNPHKKKRK